MVYICQSPCFRKNTDKANLEGEKIPKLHTYFSIQFRDTCMLLKRYYNIGKDVIHPYGNVRFTSSNSVIVSFTSTREVSFQPPSKKELIGLCVHYYFAQNMVVDKYYKIL